MQTLDLLCKNRNIRYNYILIDRKKTVSLRRTDILKMFAPQELNLELPTFKLWFIFHTGRKFIQSSITCKINRFLFVTESCKNLETNNSQLVFKHAMEKLSMIPLEKIKSEQKQI